MSHIVTIRTELRDVEAIKAACRRLEVPDPEFGKTEIFQKEVEGLLVRLPDWIFPICVQPKNGEILYDNYNGQWGDEKHLHRLWSSSMPSRKLRSKRGGKDSQFSSNRSRTGASS